MTDVDDGAGRLLARVIVNRLWQHHFGRGIVATPSDFGTQGDKPTHPELLDWLAKELIDSGWKLKHIHKLMMTSAAYMESSAGDKAKGGGGPGQPAVLAVRAAPAGGGGDPRLDAGGERPARPDDVRPRHAGPNAEAAGDLLHGQAQPADPDDDAVRRPGFAGRHRGAADDDGGAAGAVADEQRPGARLRDASGEARPADGRTSRWRTRCAPATRIALGRAPTDQEAADAVQFIQEQAAAYKKDGKPDAERLALTDLCQVLMELNEFIYVD